MRASVSVKPSRRRSRPSGPIIASGSSGSRRWTCTRCHVLDVLGEPEDHPPPVRRIVDTRRAPALQRVNLRDRRLLHRLACMPLVRDRAARSRRGRSASSRSGAANGRDQPLDDRLVFGGRGNVRAALEQRQRAPPDEVDFEAEQVVLGARRGARSRPPRASTSNSRSRNRLTCGAIAISRFESADRRTRRVRVRGDTRPTRPTARIGGGRFLAERSYSDASRSGSCRSANVNPRPPGEPSRQS